MPQDKNELLQELIEKYAKMYMKLAYNRGVPYDDVEDVVMAAFWSFYKSDHFGKLSEEANKIMMARIVINKCTDYYRKNGRVELVGIEDCTTEIDKISGRLRNGMDDKLIEDENYRRICDTIDNLKEIWRDPVRMYFIEERSTAEICEALEISEATCRKRISRAKEHLKEKLRDLWDET